MDFSIYQMFQITQLDHLKFGIILGIEIIKKLNIAFSKNHHLVYKPLRLRKWHYTNKNNIFK